MTFITGSHSKVIRILTAACASLLALLYVGSTVEIDEVHAVLHEGDIVLHTPAQERDPCHRTIYHNDVVGGCHHKSHLTPTDICPLCQISLHSQHLPTQPAHFVFVNSVRGTVDVIFSSRILPAAHHFDSRGPPMA